MSVTDAHGTQQAHSQNQSKPHTPPQNAPKADLTSFVFNERAGVQGFEPQMAGPEPAALPLGDTPKRCKHFIPVETVLFAFLIKCCSELKRICISAQLHIFDTGDSWHSQARLSGIYPRAIWHCGDSYR